MSNPSLSTVILLPLRTSGFMHTPSCECCAITHQCGITRHWHWRHALQVQRNKNAYCHCCDWLKELPYYSCQSFSYDIKKWRGQKHKVAKFNSLLNEHCFHWRSAYYFSWFLTSGKSYICTLLRPPPPFISDNYIYSKCETAKPLVVIPCYAHKKQL